MAKKYSVASSGRSYPQLFELAKWFAAEYKKFAKHCDAAEELALKHGDAFSAKDPYWKEWRRLEKLNQRLLKILPKSIEG